MNERFPDERLNAYLDGELDLDECMALLEAIERNAGLRARLARLRATRVQVREAYRRPPPPAPRRRIRQTRPAVAAGLALVLLAGAALGWSANQLSRPAHLDDLVRVVHAPGPQQEHPVRVLLHLTTGDPHRLSVFLRETAHLLDSHGPDELQVEVVATGPGLRLLQRGSSPDEHAVLAMQEKYANLAFLACRETLARVERETGTPVSLIDGAGSVRSAFDQAIRRQNEGWMYFKI